MTAIGKIPHFIRNDNKTTDILFIDFLSCTKVLMLLFLTAFNAFAETATERWVEQEGKTKDFRFCLKFTTNQYGGTELVALKVINSKTDKVIQEIPIKDADIIPPGEQLLGLDDINFDNYPDILIDVYQGGNHGNGMAYFYMYDKKAKKFKFEETLSSLSLVEINPKNKTITASMHTGSYDGSETYRYIKGRLTLVESCNENSEDNGEAWTAVSGKLRKGKMIYKKTRQRERGAC